MGAVPDAPVQDDAATQARAHHDDHRVAHVRKRTAGQLGQGCTVAIVLDAHAHARTGLEVGLDVGPGVVAIAATSDHEPRTLIDLSAVAHRNATLGAPCLLVEHADRIEEGLAVFRASPARRSGSPRP